MEEVQKVGRGCNGCITAGSSRNRVQVSHAQTLHDNVIPFNPAEPRKPWDVSGVGAAWIRELYTFPLFFSLPSIFIFFPPFSIFCPLLFYPFWTSNRTFAVRQLTSRSIIHFFESNSNDRIGKRVRNIISWKFRSERCYFVSFFIYFNHSHFVKHLFPCKIFCNCL